MDEATKRTWDVWLGILAPVLTVAGILVGVGEFRQGSLDQTRLEITRNDLAFRQAMRQQRLQSYATVATLAGQVAAAKPGRDRDKAVEAFESAYWGAMVMVEDKAVERAMMDFHYELHDQATGWSHDPQRLEVRAVALAEACRRSLEADTAAALAPRL